MSAPARCFSTAGATATATTAPPGCFPPGCGASAFAIDGWVASETHVILEGWRPVFRNCHPTGDQTWERLEFTYSYSD